MEELLFSALDIACIIDNFDLSEKRANELLNRIWNEDRSFLLANYRDNYRQWILDVRYWSHYLHNKMTFDKELPVILSDCKDSLDDELFIEDDFNFDLFFKSIRIRILYIEESGYTRMKLRTLLSAYGYKRRSQDFISYVKKCLNFYHIQITLRGNVPCDVESINLDDMITFRVI